MEEQRVFTSQAPAVHLDRATAVINGSSTPRPPVRVMLWCVPRSVSTAFLKCIDSLECRAEIFHEPYSVAYYFGPEKQAPSGPPIPEEGQYTYSWVQKQLEADYIGSEVIFCKDMAFTVDGRYDSIPDGFKHTFLIRKPVKSLMSYHKVVNGYPGYDGEEVSVKNGLPKGYAFKEAYDLYNHVCATCHEKPIIVDADDLCRSPDSILRKYCEAVGLPFTQDMLSWQPSDGISSRWHCAPSFRALNSVMGTYERALKSESFLSRGNSRADLMLKDELPKGVVECCEFSEPYYKKLFELRLKP